MLTAINSLKSSDARDLYGVSNNIVKIHKDDLKRPLTVIFNDLLSRAEFPDVLKCAVVKPLFKEGDRTSVNNYRPISLTPIFAKILEKIIRLMLLKHLYKNEVINEKQFGFTDKSNTEAAVMCLLNNIYTPIENKKLTAVVMIDFKKAFDCISYEILFKNILKLSLNEKLCNIFKSFLSNRTQKLKIYGIHSSVLGIFCGVPQGTVLGPILFSVYINSIAQLKLIGKIQKFADDIALVYGEINEDCLESAIEEDFIAINEWFTEHAMSINIKKTVFIVFSGRKICEAPRPHPS